MNNKQQQVFFQIHQGLPREGPGDCLHTHSAFLKMVDLAPHPQILDIGCRPGAHTVFLTFPQASICGTVNICCKYADFPIKPLDYMHNKSMACN